MAVNLLITFGLCGLWHGAAWKFVAFGILHAGILFLETVFPAFKKLGWITGLFYTNVLWIFGCIIFRADDLGHAWQYVSNVFSRWHGMPVIPPRYELLVSLFVLAVVAPLFLLLEARMGSRKNLLDFERRRLRIAAFYLMALLFLVIGRFTDNAFIYFQF